jgi:hypothetical protein
VSLKSNGYRSVTIKGVKRRVYFRLEYYKTGSDFFNLSGQFMEGLESQKLKKRIKLELSHKRYNGVSDSLEMLSS